MGNTYVGPSDRGTVGELSSKALASQIERAITHLTKETGGQIGKLNLSGARTSEKLAATERHASRLEDPGTIFGNRKTRL